MMFIYITVETLKTFYLSFPLSRQGPLMYSFDFTLIFSVYSYEEVIVF